MSAQFVAGAAVAGVGLVILASHIQRGRGAGIRLACAVAAGAALISALLAVMGYAEHVVRPPQEWVPDLVSPLAGYAYIVLTQIALILTAVVLLRTGYPPWFGWTVLILTALTVVLLLLEPFRHSSSISSRCSWESCWLRCRPAIEPQAQQTQTVRHAVRLDERRCGEKLAEIERRGRAAFLEGAEERSGRRGSAADGIRAEADHQALPGLRAAVDLCQKWVCLYPDQDRVGTPGSAARGLAVIRRDRGVGHRQLSDRRASAAHASSSVTMM